MRTQVLRLVLGLILVGMAVGCTEPAEEGPVKSAKSRMASDASVAEMAEQAAGNRAFAFDLYQTLSEGSDGNLLYSPYSISLALAMTHAGARGETEQQMAKTLHFTLPSDRLHPVVNGLDLELAQRGKSAKGKEGGLSAEHHQLSLGPGWLHLLARVPRHPGRTLWRGPETF